MLGLLAQGFQLPEDVTELTSEGHFEVKAEDVIGVFEEVEFVVEEGKFFEGFGIVSLDASLDQL